MDIMRTSAPVLPAQDRASFEVRSILKLNPAAQLLLWPSFQHFKGWRFHRLSGLHSMSNHLHWEQFYPSLWAVFLALRGVHCLQPLHCCLWEQSVSVPLHKSPPDPHCSVPFQAFISMPHRPHPRHSLLPQQPHWQGWTCSTLSELFSACLFTIK